MNITIFRILVLINMVLLFVACESASDSTCVEVNDNTSIIGFWKINKVFAIDSYGIESERALPGVVGLPDTYQMYIVFDEDSTNNAFLFEDTYLSDVKQTMMVQTISSAYHRNVDSLIIINTVNISTGLPDTSIVKYQVTINQNELVLSSSISKVYLLKERSVENIPIIEFNEYMSESNH